MRLTMHIFKKDARYLGWEIAVFLSLVAIFSWRRATGRDAWWAEMLLWIGAAYIIARLIHAEPILGTTQFWITRPYHWKVLLISKLLFILVFVNVPVFLAQFCILLAMRFPVVPSLPGLLWSQVLMMFCAALPVAALAAVTRGLATFTSSALVLLAIAMTSSNLKPGIRSPQSLPWPDGVDWVRDAVVFAAIAGAAIAVLYLQYKGRRTLVSRLLAVAVVILSVAAYAWMPWPIAWAVNSMLGSRSIPASAVQMVLGVNPRPKYAVLDGFRLPLSITGVPDGMEVRPDALAIAFEGRGGRTWESPLWPREEDNLTRYFTIDPAFYDQVRGQSVTLRVRAYLTLFGNTRVRQSKVSEWPVNAIDGLQCFDGDRKSVMFADHAVVVSHFYCRAPFRWPRAIVYAKFGDNSPSSFTELISYSPFPAGLSLDDSIETRWIDGPPASTSEATIIVKEPIAHIRRDLEVRGVHLDDFKDTTR